FCRKVDRRLVSRHDVLLLIKLGALGFTGLSRAQLAAAEQQYTVLADAVRSAEGDPAGLVTRRRACVRPDSPFADPRVVTRNDRGVRAGPPGFLHVEPHGAAAS